MSDQLADLLRQHTTLFAAFDDGVHADISRGDGTATMHADAVRHDPLAGRFGGGLVFSAQHHGWAEDEFLFAARGNFPYRETSFDGTISLWLCGDPDADLNDEYPVDPFHISRHPADGSFYLDLTRPNDWRYGSPRKLRFGLYGDSPAQDMFQGGQLIVVGDLGWNDGAWHHVAAVWRNANSGEDNAYAALYVDGVLRGWMEGFRHRLTWNIDEMTIGLGQRYAGCIDEILLLDTCLPEELVLDLYERTKPLLNLYSHQ